MRSWKFVELRVESPLRHQRPVVAALRHPPLSRTTIMSAIHTVEKRWETNRVTPPDRRPVSADRVAYRSKTACSAAASSAAAGSSRTRRSAGPHACGSGPAPGSATGPRRVAGTRPLRTPRRPGPRSATARSATTCPAEADRDHREPPARPSGEQAGSIPPGSYAPGDPAGVAPLLGEGPHPSLHRSGAKGCLGGQTTVQGTPLRVKEVGLDVLPLWFAWKPMSTVAPGAIVAL